LLGAVDLLTNPYNWYKWGSYSPEESAEAWKEIWNEAVYEPACEVNVPAPYWDDDDDVDDEAPADMQPWYGYVTDPEVPPEELTFIENAAIWVITGFLAFATFEVGFAPAIFFHSIAPRFVLAWKKTDIRTIIRVIIDAVEYGRVDTADYPDGEVIEMAILANPELEGHDIQIIDMGPP
jgi:hypothetical protein